MFIPSMKQCSHTCNCEPLRVTKSLIVDWDGARAGDDSIKDITATTVMTAGRMPALLLYLSVNNRRHPAEGDAISGNK